MSAEFTTLPDNFDRDDIISRLLIVVDLSESLREFSNSIASRVPGREGDGDFYIVYECADRIYKEANEIVGGVEGLLP